MPGTPPRLLSVPVRPWARSVIRRASSGERLTWEAGPAAAALETLEALGGKEVDASLAQKLETADPRLRPVLIELAGRRRIAAARAALRKAADDESESIRVAALRALGMTAET